MTGKDRTSEAAVVRGAIKQLRASEPFRASRWSRTAIGGVMKAYEFHAFIVVRASGPEEAQMVANHFAMSVRDVDVVSFGIDDGEPAEVTEDFIEFI